MPKCINDPLKSYTGKEPSPKGLGYSASIEIANTIKTGKDGNQWIVRQTIKYKRWQKVSIHIPKLSKDCFTDVYYPKCNEIYEETGLEDKFGGSVPFFTNDMTWPLDNSGVPMTFLYQLRDPLNIKDITLHQAFIPIDGDEEYVDESNIILKKIILNDEILDNQLIIDKPSFSGKNTVYKAFEIIEWNRSKELKDIRYIMNKYSITDIKLYEDLYENHERYPSFTIKIGGTPQYCQYHSYDSKDTEHFLQITGCIFMNYAWGDCGIAHISRDSQLYWDCC